MLSFFLLFLFSCGTMGSSKAFKSPREKTDEKGYHLGGGPSFSHPHLTEVFKRLCGTLGVPWRTVWEPPVETLAPPSETQSWSKHLLCPGLAVWTSSFLL